MLQRAVEGSGDKLVMQSLKHLVRSQIPVVFEMQQIYSEFEAEIVS